MWGGGGGGCGSVRACMNIPCSVNWERTTRSEWSELYGEMTTETGARRGVTTRVMFHGSQRPREEREQNQEWEDRLVDRLLVRMVERSGEGAGTSQGRQGVGTSQGRQEAGTSQGRQTGKRVRKVSGNEGRGGRTKVRGVLPIESVNH